MVLAGLSLYHRRLAAYALRRWDEAIYANVAKQMVQDGYWLIPHVRGGLGAVGLHPFLEKPPLALWLQTVSMSVLGVDEFAARLPSATFAVPTAVVVHLLGRDVDTRLTGYLGALVFLLTPQLYGATNLGALSAPDQGKAMNTISYRSHRSKDRYSSVSCAGRDAFSRGPPVCETTAKAIESPGESGRQASLASERSTCL